MFTPAFLFPPENRDSSLKELSDTKVQNILNRACTTNRLPAYTLGTVTSYT